MYKDEDMKGEALYEKTWMQVKFCASAFPLVCDSLPRLFN